MNEMTKNQSDVHDSLIDWILPELNKKIRITVEINFGEGVKKYKNYKIVGGLAGTGKSEPIDKKIQTPTGPKEIGQLKIGDDVFGQDGKIHKVDGVFPQGIQQAYKITFRDGYSTEVNKDHLWAVWTNKLRQRKKPPVVITTEEIINKGVKLNCGLYRFSIPLCDPVDYSEKQLPIHPYLLGLFIGDGTNLNSSPTLCVPDLDKTLIEYANEIKPAFSDIVEDRSSNCPRYRFVDRGYYGNRLNKIFKSLNLDVKSIHKFIPDIYKYSSKDQRYNLLRGLMDTDGSCNNNRTTFSTSSNQLADDIIELVQSLGGIAIKYIYDRPDRNNIEYGINIKTIENPFRLKRKSDKWSFSTKNPPSRHIINIEKSRIVDQVCISVNSKDNLYLTDHFIVTHNTTLAANIRKTLHKEKHISVAFCAFTGKASSVLHEKLKEEGAIYPQDSISTIHGLIYEPILDYDQTTRQKHVCGWRKSRALAYDLIIVDEGSMVSSVIWDDILSYGIPIIVFGDHGQLPPVGDAFNLMEVPDFILTEIMRQSLDSQIIRLSMLVRNEGKIPHKVFSPEVFKLSWRLPKCKELFNSIKFDSDTIGLCGFNTTRKKLNSIIRRSMNFTMDLPYPSERVVCLRNNHNSKIFNGQLGTVMWSMPKEDGLLDMTIQSDNSDELCECLVHEMGFGDKTDSNEMYQEVKSEKYKKYVGGFTRQIDLFDYGYVISVHKSQGSSFDRVVLFEQRSKYGDDEFYMKWLYTGVTRAVSKLFIISDYF